MGDWRACSLADGDDLVKWKFDEEESLEIFGPLQTPEQTRTKSGMLQ